MAFPSSEIQASDLGLEHLAALEQAISNVLSTELAFETFAQVIDGIPTRDAYFDYYLPTPRPEYSQISKPSNDANQILQTFHGSFYVGMLKFRSNTAQAYQNTPLRSGDFKPRLMELVAVACHNIAVELYIKAGGGIQKPPRCLQSLGVILSFDPRYRTSQNYIVGYWAEYRLFGGVVLFDRGESGLECKSAFIHPIKARRIYQLSDQQIDGFCAFVSSKHSHEYTRSYSTRFPAEHYARRVDPFDSMALGIYRDVHERKLPDPRQRRCVIHPEDDPVLFEQMRKFSR
ncbi:hypothetical protein FQN55_000520 [Onygenales sp. PD_40]|nr:hypothetical protein FQN55_000520 [Onygenales sp. PD_40]KAK2779533.1 hypothetical protein FQN52_002401 [Onygenales sp. PD_12]